MADLRLTLQRAEQQQAKKEDYLREEISELQQVTRALYFLLTGIITLSISYQLLCRNLDFSRQTTMLISTVGKKNICSPADFVRLPTDKEMISLSF